MLESDDIHLSRCDANSDTLTGSIITITISNIEKDKSFADDLNRERGIVSVREGFVPRSAEIKPLFRRFVH